MMYMKIRLILLAVKVIKNIGTMYRCFFKYYVVILCKRPCTVG